MTVRYCARTILGSVLIVLFAASATLASRIPPPFQQSSAGLNFIAYYGTGVCQAVSVSGNVLAIGKGGDVQYYDVSTPGSPVELGNAELGRVVQFLICEGAVTYALISDAISPSILVTIDSSDPSSPVVLAGWTAPGHVVGFGKHGNYVYLATTFNTQIVNVTTPATPSFAGTTLQSNTTVGFGNNLFLLNNRTLRVMDNTDPTSPVEIGSITHTYTMWDIALSADGQTAYVTQDGVRIIDVSTPSAPANLGFWQTAALEFFFDITLSSAGLYAIHPSGSVYLVDVTTDPALPSTIGSLTMNTLVDDLTVDPGNPNTVYFPVGTGALTGDFTTPATPVKGAFMYTGFFMNDILAEDISGSPPFTLGAPPDNIRVSTASGRGGVQRYRGLGAEDMIHFPELYSALFGAEENYEQVSEDKARLTQFSLAIWAASFGSVAKVNVENANATIEGTVTTGGNSVAMTMGIDHLYVAEGTSGDVFVVDTAALTLANTLNTGGNARGLAFEGFNMLLAIANGFNPDQVQVFDVRDPLVAQAVSNFSPGLNIATVVFDGDVLFLADLDQNVYIYDISDRGNPVQTGTFNLGTFSQILSLTYEGTGVRSSVGSSAQATDYLIVTASEAGVFLLDVTVPGAVTLAGTFDTGDLATQAVVLNGQIYVADGFAGWYVLEINPQVPVLITNFEAQVRGGAAELRWAISSDEPVDGVDIHRSADGGVMRSILEGQLLDINARRFVDDSVEPGGSYEYLLVVLKPDGSVVRSPRVTVNVPESTTRLLTNFPNPFNPSTTIAFDLASPGHVTVSIYDVSGVHVSTIANRRFPSGRGEVDWNGLDGAGHRVASGVYLYEVRVGKQTFQGKMQLLK